MKVCMTSSATPPQSHSICESITHRVSILAVMGDMTPPVKHEPILCEDCYLTLNPMRLPPICLIIQTDALPNG